MKKLAVFLLVCSFTLLFSCKKNKTAQCDTARICMVNQTADTIHYCWGCNDFSETVAPGEKACRDVQGPINESSTVWVDFQTAAGTTRVEVSECYVEEVIQ
jgi:hypothetical protein